MRISEDVILPDRLWTELVQWRSGYQCEQCGQSRDDLRAKGYAGQLHAHHKDHDHSNNRLDNGECVCPPCHGRHHRKTYEIAPCEPGCTCGKHREAWNRIKPGQKCRHGHDDWMLVGKHQKITCRTCRNEYSRRYYQEHAEYKKLQGERSNARRKRLKQSGESD